ncbi:MAG TPA: cytochrome-c peroxidase [Pusillimonas sp.]|uniref:cytochrome-c peroxidase n=1 Tax=unclassified Pusillimonas TaxID=2640016 RepID=UPI0026030FEB|nr:MULTISPECIES: cytochrome-c peroxidase [unclassified Pusillimonas]HLU19912.1 cytochrome-c peroxidase [Pusillimonas sp.]
MKRVFSSLLAVPALLVSAASFAQSPDVNELRELAGRLFAPIPQVQEIIEQKKLSSDQIELGKWLFFEPRLSSSHIITCNTCHSVGTGGADNIPTSIGHGWQAGPRNSPTVLNAVFNAAQFWDGRAADLAEQAKGPVQASVEMNATPDHVEKTLKSIPEYVELFAKAFPSEKEPVTFDNMAKAIEAFESTLVTPNSRFDQFLAGKDSMSDLEIKGLSLFINKGCVACHSGINVGGQGYFPFGVIKRPGADILPPDDKGRFTVTATASDEYVFRAGPLRNIALTAPYFHSGEVWDLEMAVAIMGTSQLGQELDESEVKAITAWLHTLTGDQPRVEYPTLPPSTPATPRPTSM